MSRYYSEICRAEAVPVNGRYRINRDNPARKNRCAHRYFLVDVEIAGYDHFAGVAGQDLFQELVRR